MNTIFETTLKNGLTVRLKEIHTSPIISHWVWYRVGSRNEIPGTTGISHWVEHMQFKGTPKFPASILDKPFPGMADTGMPLPIWIGQLSLKPSRPIK